jgi:hypothetical protein
MNCANTQQSSSFFLGCVKHEQRNVYCLLLLYVVGAPQRLSQNLNPEKLTGSARGLVLALVEIFVGRLGLLGLQEGQNAGGGGLSTPYVRKITLKVLWEDKEIFGKARKAGKQYRIKLKIELCVSAFQS